MIRSMLGWILEGSWVDFGRILGPFPSAKPSWSPKSKSDFGFTSLLRFHVVGRKFRPAGSSREDPDLRVFISRPRLGDSGATPFWCV